MKHYIIPILDIAFLYLVYHIVPWPTAVLIYGSIVLASHAIIIAVSLFKLKILLTRLPVYKRSILHSFIVYLSVLTIYITSTHEIAQYIAVSMTIIFCLLYYIRYKTQQLF